MDPAFMEKLMRLRVDYGKPMIVTSAYRCPTHNAAVSNGDSDPHTTGLAIDIQVSGKDTHRLMGFIFALKFAGVGVSQKDDHSGRFIHLDDTPNSPERPRPWLWSY